MDLVPFYGADLAHRSERLVAGRAFHTTNGRGQLKLLLDECIGLSLLVRLCVTRDRRCHRLKFKDRSPAAIAVSEHLTPAASP